jgi:hypothetical protein
VVCGKCVPVHEQHVLPWIWWSACMCDCAYVAVYGGLRVCVTVHMLLNCFEQVQAQLFFSTGVVLQLTRRAHTSTAVARSTMTAGARQRCRVSDARVIVDSGTQDGSQQHLDGSLTACPQSQEQRHLTVDKWPDKWPDLTIISTLTAAV